MWMPENVMEQKKAFSECRLVCLGKKLKRHYIVYGMLIKSNKKISLYWPAYRMSRLIFLDFHARITCSFHYLPVKHLCIIEIYYK